MVKADIDAVKQAYPTAGGRIPLANAAAAVAAAFGYSVPEFVRQVRDLFVTDTLHPTYPDWSGLTLQQIGAQLDAAKASLP